MTDAPNGWPQGFHAWTGRIGLRDEEGDDLALLASDRPCTSAAVFTRSLFAGAAVVVNRRHAPAGRTRAVVTVAKNANVATGEQGERDAQEITALAAAALGVPAEQVLIGSTGVIGRPLPMDPVRDALATAAARWPVRRTASPLDVAAAMMTTDTRPKTATARVGNARIVGVAKGVGMLEPDMATMLAYLATDAEVPADRLDAALRAAVGTTFNCLSVDTDTSTSDTVALLANGAAGPVDPDAFTAALTEVCLDLTRQLAADGEGATKLIEVTVGEARDRDQAKRVAKAVVNSPLVKTAVHGADPNWGRVVMAVGKCTDDIDIDPARVRVAFGGLQVYPGQVDQDALARLTEIMKQPEVAITVALGTGDAAATVYGCDLSAGYVRINADYTT
ncbi:bifunctional glutamate N-acetyltransferase/amino-acid acetyltransferase ArgJ [Streptomyces sp. NPDC092296]|uniref:bifunctional glutamate N-acetyltransferase/amino-acid acetyltransferase ArgJ n=1 Tax=Streptomyces sp. NPDC092296 TaxID=3366012 RepID=UPI00380305D7